MNNPYPLLRQAALAAGSLLHLHVDLTHRCDHRCTHCYLHGRSAEGLPGEVIRELLADGKQLGALFLLFSGGEPFLRPDLLDLIAEARRLRYAVKLATHGGHLDRRLARELARLAVFEVGVSLFSMDPAVHEQITRRTGSHAATLSGLYALREAGVRTLIKIIVLPANAGRWQGVPELAHKLGAGIGLDTLLFPTHTGTAGVVLPQAVPLDEKIAVVRARLRWQQQEHAGRPVDPAETECSTRQTAAPDAPLCVAGRTSLFVHPTGVLQPCAFWPHPLGDLRRERLREAWPRLRQDPFLRTIRRDAMQGCENCPEQTECSRCPGLQEQLSGSPLQRVEPICERTRALRCAQMADDSPDETP